MYTIALNIELGRFYTQNDYDEKLKNIEELKLQTKFIPETHIKTLEELERRKKTNTESLRSDGLDV